MSDGEPVIVAFVGEGDALKAVFDAFLHPDDQFNPSHRRREFGSACGEQMLGRIGLDGNGAWVIATTEASGSDIVVVSSKWMAEGGQMAAAPWKVRSAGVPVRSDCHVVVIREPGDGKPINPHRLANQIGAFVCDTRLLGDMQVRRRRGTGCRRWRRRGPGAETSSVSRVPPNIVRRGLAKCDPGYCDGVS